MTIIVRFSSVRAERSEFASQFPDRPQDSTGVATFLRVDAVESVGYESRATLGHVELACDPLGGRVLRWQDAFTREWVRRDDETQPGDWFMGAPLGIGGWAVPILLAGRRALLPDYSPHRQ